MTTPRDYFWPGFADEVEKLAEAVYGYRESSPQTLKKKYADRVRRALEQRQKTAAEKLRAKVDVFVYDDKDRVLTRKKGPSYTFPGGGLDNDSVNVAARKEVLEEAGYSVHRPHGVGVGPKTILWDTPKMKKEMTRGGRRTFGGSKLYFRAAKMKERDTSVLGSEGDAIKGLRFVPIDRVIKSLRQSSQLDDNDYRKFDEQKMRALEGLHRRLSKTSSANVMWAFADEFEKQAALKEIFMPFAGGRTPSLIEAKNILKKIRGSKDIKKEVSGYYDTWRRSPDMQSRYTHLKRHDPGVDPTDLGLFKQVGMMARGLTDKPALKDAKRLANEMFDTSAAGRTVTAAAFADELEKAARESTWAAFADEFDKLAFTSKWVNKLITAANVDDPRVQRILSKAKNIEARGLRERDVLQVTLKRSRAAAEKAEKKYIGGWQSRKADLLRGSATTADEALKRAEGQMADFWKRTTQRGPRERGIRSHVESLTGPATGPAPAATFSFLKRGFDEEFEDAVAASRVKIAASRVPRKVVDAANKDPFIRRSVSTSGWDKRYTITHQGRVIGFLTPRKEHGKIRLGPIFVMPEYRGQGFAAAAIRKYVGKKPARAVIDKDNRKSARAFLSAGFEKVKTVGEEMFFEKNTGQLEKKALSLVVGAAGLGLVLGASHP